MATDHARIDARRLPYIGTGLQHSNWSGSGRCDFHHSIEYAGALSNMLEREDLPGGMIYTATMAFPSSVMLNADKHDRAVEILEDGQALLAEGRIQYASYTQVHQTWLSDYGGVPNILTYDQVDPDEYPCDED